MDSLQRDRFELLSAYLDGEVTATERQQVMAWLETDPQAQQQYAKLLKLRQGLQAMPVPQPAKSTERTTKEIFAKIDRHRQRRTLILGGGAIAALFVGLISSVVPNSQSLSPQLAQSSTPASSEVNAEPIMVALNEPAIKIPKAAIAPEKKSNAVNVDGE